MSVNFPIVDLFWTIFNNDIEKLDDAILFIGPQIHTLEVWIDLSAIGYAARLGHFEQVQLLLNDLEKYDVERVKYNRIQSLFVQAYSDCNINFLQTLMDKYPNIFTGVIEAMGVSNLVKEDAVDTLVAILLKYPDLLSSVVKECSAQGNRKCYLALQEVQRISAPTGGQGELETPCGGDPLARAILLGDTDEFSRLLPELFSWVDSELGGRSRRFASRYPSRRSSPCKFEVTRLPHAVQSVFWNRRAARCSVLGVARLVIRTDDVALFKILMVPGYISKLKGEDHNEAMDENTVFEALFSLALECEAVKIIDYLIEMIRSKNIPDLRPVDWDLIYFNQLAQGRVKSAAAIEDLRKSTERIVDSGWEQTHYLVDVVFRQIKLRDEATVELLERLVIELEPFIRKVPDSDRVWEELLDILCNMPLEYGRPDLVRPSQKYGIQYSELYVLENMNSRANRTFLRSSAWDCYPDDSIKPDRDVLSNIRVESLAPCYLGERKQDLKLSEFIKFTELGRTLLTECVLQTGKALPVKDASSLYHEETKDFLQHLDRDRRSSLTLQKLCRQRIRRSVRDASKRRLTSAILSLYRDGYMPKRLVKYLLYREDHLSRPLFHLLVDFEEGYEYQMERLSYIEELLDTLQGSGNVSDFYHYSAFDYDRVCPSYDGCDD